MSLTPWSPQSLLQPSSASLPAGYSPAPVPCGPVEPPLNYYLAAIFRYRWQVIGTVAACVALTWGISSLIHPMYEATATIEIDPRVPGGVMESGAAQITGLDADQFMATQLKLVQSDAVVRNVAAAHDLVRLEQKGLRAVGAAVNPAAKIAADIAPVTLRQLRVNRPPNTFLMQVSYRSPDPALSAAVANEIADAYVQRTWDLRYQSSLGFSAFMGRRLAEVKGRMEASSGRLASFEHDFNVADPEQKTAILTSRLVQLNTEYVTAQAARLQKEAAFNSVRNGSLEAAQASTQGESLRKLGERLNEAQERFALTKSQFGKNFPEYKKSALEVQEIQGQLDEARANIAKRVEVEFHEAANRESMLNGAVSSLKREFDRLNARSFEYQLLRRDAESDRKLYDELELRINEAQTNAGFRNSSIRIADIARPPLKPAFPNTPLNLLVAFGFSLCGALMVAIAADRREIAIQDPERARADLNISVLGTLPWIEGDSKASSFERFMYDEAVQALCSTVALSPHLGELRSVAVTSALPGEGKTFTACNLATANARKGRPTLLIDADLHHPCVGTQCGLEPHAGLEAVLQGKLDWREAVHQVAEVPGLAVLSAVAGHGEMAGLLGRRLPEILAEAAKEYELIVIDSPPILGFSASLDIAAVTDSVLLLAVPGETHTRLLRNCIVSLRQIGTRNLGLVLNRITAGNAQDAYYGNYEAQYRRYREVA